MGSMLRLRDYSPGLRIAGARFTHPMNVVYTLREELDSQSYADGFFCLCRMSGDSRHGPEPTVQGQRDGRARYPGWFFHV